MRRILIINQADTPEEVLNAESIAETAAGDQSKIDMVIISSLRNDYKIRSIICP